MKRAFSVFMFVLLLVSMLTFSSNFQSVKASGTIYIRADGSVDPPDAPITTVDNVIYTLTGNIYDSIVIERDSIVVDGARYTVQGTGTGTGIDLSFRNNITVRNIKVTNSFYGICLDYSVNHTLSGNTATKNTIGIRSYYTSNHILSGNNVSFNTNNGIDFVGDNAIIVGNNVSSNLEGINCDANNTVFSNNIVSNNRNRGIVGQFSNTVFSGNIASNNGWEGIQLTRDSANNTLVGNNVSSTGFGLAIGGSNNIICGNIAINGELGVDLGYGNSNTVVGNNIINNYYGIRVLESFNNIIYHNNLINNTEQVFPLDPSSTNTWDNRYPSGGNYWSDYAGVDAKYGASQDLPGSDGIGDTPYIIDANNVDHYPLMHPYGSIRNLNTSLTYLTIQSAINAPETSEGDAIFIRNGTYLEHVMVNKTVSLIGENKEATMISSSPNDPFPMVDITANSVTIRNLMLCPANWSSGALTLWSNCTIIDSNIIMKTDQGIVDCAPGFTRLLTNNTIINNIIRNNTKGLVLMSAEGYRIEGNTVENNDAGVWILGGSWANSYNNTIINNTVSSNGIGLILMGSDWNTIIGNYIANSTIDGLRTISACYNRVYHNCFGNNTNQVLSTNSTNVWDDGYPSGGNYWSDHTGVDEKSGSNQDQPGGDGIGDTPYTIADGNIDNYPLMMPYQPLHEGDVNRDGVVDIKDVAIVSSAFGSYSGHARWNPLGDLNDDGRIDIMDLAKTCANFGWHEP